MGGSAIGAGRRSVLAPIVFIVALIVGLNVLLIADAVGVPLPV
ncbi:hypothetical protein MBEHAL_1491 [Halarchaeum acidiphilum MH1-52-1]|uniref:Uncharacterized protein n=1 Tax=Halarchaeum acidiphilum MH1-52-1 TaxID=1261545 RepID=U2YFD7_9EURY|nr:hypothetical protein MBEHAL_1491 [Halarchaeum acidiphilum MH1-52-1]